MPEVGASSPPSRCSSVLLPEPDAPTMATVSPACTLKSTPCSTVTSSAPSTKRLTRPWHWRTVSLIAQRLRRVDTAGTPAGVERGDEGQYEGNDGDGHDVGALRVAGHAVDEVDVLG